MICVKIHVSISDGIDRRILSMCDSDLMGKKFEENDCILDLKTYRNFYEGEKISNEQALETAIEFAREFCNYNIVGKKSIAIISKIIKVEKNSIKKIKGIPHLQIFKIN